MLKRFVAAMAVAAVCSALSAQEVAWQVAYDSGNDDYPRGAAVDAQGNVYVTGYSFSGANFDCLTVKLDKDGKTLWQKRHDGGGNDAGHAISVDPRGNVYVAGFTNNGANDDFLLIRYDPDGNVVWQKGLDCGGEDWAFGVAADLQGNVYVSGTAQGETRSCVVIKCDADGKELWRKGPAIESGGFGWGVAADREGNAYVSADFDGITTKLAKYDPSGNLLWEKKAKVPDPGYSWGKTFQVAVDGRSNAYVVGSMASKATNDADVFLVKYGPNGEREWEKTYHIWGNDFGYGVAVSEEGTLCIAGSLSACCPFIKCDPNGAVLWKAKLPAVRSGAAAAFDREGNAYLCGISDKGKDYDYAIVKVPRQ